MTQDVKQQLTILAALQNAEFEMSKISKALAGVDAQIEALSTEMKTFDDRLADGRTQLDNMRAQYREDERESRTIEDRIGKDHEKLRAVKTNKEYQSMLKEIDELKKKGSQIEDRMLANLESIEQSESALAVLEKEMAVQRAEIERQQAEIRAQAETERQALERCSLERDRIFVRLDQKLQKMFEKVRTQGRGVAVSAVVDGVCQVCRMGIPPQMFNELLRMDSVRLCPNCQRIIYPKVLIEPEDCEN